MPKVLSEEQIAFYRREGYLFPVGGIAPARTRALLDAVEDFERVQGMSAGLFKLKGHLT